MVAHSAIASHVHLSQICRIGGGLCFFGLHVTSLPEVNTHRTIPLCGYGVTRIWNWRAFIIQLIGSSPSARRARDNP